VGSFSQNERDDVDPHHTMHHLSAPVTPGARLGSFRRFSFALHVRSIREAASGDQLHCDDSGAQCVPSISDGARARPRAPARTRAVRLRRNAAFDRIFS
jgi:hypothetical protein